MYVATTADEKGPRGGNLPSPEPTTILRKRQRMISHQPSTTVLPFPSTRRSRTRSRGTVQAEIIALPQPEPEPDRYPRIGGTASLDDVECGRILFRHFQRLDDARKVTLLDIAERFREAADAEGSRWGDR